jgi:aminopeptidase-like protein
MPALEVDNRGHALDAKHSSLSSDDGGEAMHQLIAELYPVCRSITGDGVRKTLNILRSHIHLDVHEVPSGLRVFDWTVPAEWNIRDAYIKDRHGQRVVDFRKSNLHVVGYSIPIHETMSLDTLRNHLFSIPERPDWIPYRTTYYTADWGFCLSHNQLLAMAEGDYEVCIDSSLAPGHLTYGELLLPGQSNDEVLISCHVCHPSLGNDNLSGIAVAAALAQQLSGTARRYSYRFLFIPGTIGSITWLALHRPQIARIKHGFVLTCVGDRGTATYKQSRAGNAEIDQAWSYVLSRSKRPFNVRPFTPFGYDERQFCSPGINLPVGCFMRTPHGEFPEYHTSADDPEFVSASSLHDSFATALKTIDVLEHNGLYLNKKPYCEPQLGKYGLYRRTGGDAIGDRQLALLWVLNLSDGDHSLLDIAIRSNLAWDTIKEAVRALSDSGLIVPVGEPTTSPARHRLKG